MFTYLRRTPVLGCALLWGCGGSSAASTDDAGSGGGGPGGPICQQPKEYGNCKGAFPRWWFDAQTGKCELFSYGGCGGNGNNFESIEECVAACAPNVGGDVCQAVSCDGTTACVYFSDKAGCAGPCDRNQQCGDPTRTCRCGSSCPGCDDCAMVCGP